MFSPAELEGMRKRPAHTGDYEHVVQPGTEIWCDGELVAGLYELEEDASELLHVCKALPYVRDYRTSGMRSHSVIFGYRPREPLRKDFCGASSLKRSDPGGYAMLDRWSSVAERYYAEARPDVYAYHRKLVLDGVDEAWRMTDSIFTSGIVNRNTSHFYHKDNGNFAGTWNSMIVLAHDISGGETVVPEFRVAFDYDNRPSVLVFPAEATWHAVKKVHARGRMGHRFSVVFYSMAGMCKCGTRKEELLRVRKQSTERARVRADREALVERLMDKGTKKTQAVIERMRASGELEPKELTLEERIERLRQSPAARASSVLKRLERQLAKQRKEKG